MLPRPRRSMLHIAVRGLTALCLSTSLSAAAAAELTGQLWHSFRDLGNPSGSFVTDPGTGRTRQVSREKWATPWPDGSRYLVRDYTSHGARGGETRLLVRSNDHAVLMDQLVDGYIADDVRPSPRGTNQLIAMWGESLLKPRAAVVYDLDARRLLYVTPPSRTPDALSWLPDGSLLRVQPSGQISKVVIGGGEQPIAHVRWPEGRVPQAVHVDPGGRQALVQLAAWRDTGTVSGADLWMMKLDGSGLRRFTKNNLIAHAFWSPDGRQVAFVKDTGVACSAATCQGSCTLWYAAATATEVVATAPSGDARRFPLKRPDGSATSIGCPGIAWTR